jgi:hypothetical protein
MHPFVISDDLKSQFHVIEEIGRGHFAEVYIGTTLPASIYY